MSVVCKRCGGPNHRADRCKMDSGELSKRKLRALAGSWEFADFALDTEFFQGKASGMKSCAADLKAFLEKL